MVAETLADFESAENSINYGGNCARYPLHAITLALREKLARERAQILSFAKENPRILTMPFGYKIYTREGNPRLDPDWRNLNILAGRMSDLGFDKLVTDLQISFGECFYQAERLAGPMTAEKKAWALALAQSSAGMFLIHALNLYEPQRGLFANMLDANLRHDALGRVNYNPVISALAKAIKKSLGWKGDASGGDEFRAEMIITLIEEERKSGRAQRRDRTGVSFEKKCRELLRGSGFDVRETPATGDFGADLIAEKDEITFVIQCKDLSKPVGVKAVQEAVGARRHYVADFACVCADSGFTEAALELAATNRVLTSSSENLARGLENAA